MGHIHPPTYPYTHPSTPIHLSIHSQAHSFIHSFIHQSIHPSTISKLPKNQQRLKLLSRGRGDIPNAVWGPWGGVSTAGGGVSVPVAKGTPLYDRLNVNGGFISDGCHISQPSPSSPSGPAIPPPPPPPRIALHRQSSSS